MAIAKFKTHNIIYYYIYIFIHGNEFDEHKQRPKFSIHELNSANDLVKICIHSSILFLFLFFMIGSLAMTFYFELISIIIFFVIRS